MRMHTTRTRAPVPCRGATDAIRSASAPSIGGPLCIALNPALVSRADPQSHVRSQQLAYGLIVVRLAVVRVSSGQFVIYADGDVGGRVDSERDRRSHREGRCGTFSAEVGSISA